MPSSGGARSGAARGRRDAGDPARKPGPGTKRGSTRAHAPQRGAASGPRWPARVNFSLTYGHPVPSTLRMLCAAGADLVVVVPGGASAGIRFLVGSVSHRLLTLTDCDTLIVPRVRRAPQPSHPARRSAQAARPLQLSTQGVLNEERLHPWSEVMLEARCAVRARRLLRARMPRARASAQRRRVSGVLGARFVGVVGARCCRALISLRHPHRLLPHRAHLPCARDALIQPRTASATVAQAVTPASSLAASACDVWQIDP